VTRNSDKWSKEGQERLSSGDRVPVGRCKGTVAVPFSSGRMQEITAKDWGKGAVGTGNMFILSYLRPVLQPKLQKSAAVCEGKNRVSVRVKSASIGAPAGKARRAEETFKKKF